MTEPRIQYAKTTDGVNVAFTTLGKGMPFVSLPLMPFSHFQLTLQLDSQAERKAKVRMLITYDNRGSGLSDREVTDFSRDEWVEKALPRRRRACLTSPAQAR